MFFVRTAMEKDLPRVREILIDTYYQTYSPLIGEKKVAEICSEFHTIEALTEKLDRPNSEFLVADNGDVVGGMAFATQSDKEIFMHQLYVHPDFHGGKTGLHLLIEIENAFMDAETLALEVLPSNIRAIGFYEKYGFKRTGEERSDCGGMAGVPSIVMEKPVFYAED
ncbi:MAG: GNAT family N-acetyltransferase [Pseudomonadota bacterium]